MTPFQEYVQAVTRRHFFASAGLYWKFGPWSLSEGNASWMKAQGIAVEEAAARLLRRPPSEGRPQAGR